MGHLIGAKSRAAAGAPAWRGVATEAARDLLLLLPLSLLLWALAYQPPLDQTIHVGGDVTLARLKDDTPYLRGVNDPEPAERLLDPDRPECQAEAPPDGCRIWWWELLRRSGGLPYRWTTAETAVVVPGAGGGPYLVQVLARGGRPDGSAVPTLWLPGDGPPVALSLRSDEDRPRRYSLLVPAGSGGELRLTMRTQPFTPAGDPRELGFVLHEVRLRDVGGVPRAPAWPTLGWLALAVGVIYGLARALHVGRPSALALGAGAALAGAGALAAARPALTVVAPALGALAVSCAGLAAAAWPLVRRAAPAVRPEAAHVLALVLLAFALRMGGLLHPHALFSDLGLHANKVYEVTLGRVFLTTGLPSDVGGGQQPYPPGAYLMLLPGQLVFGSRHLLVQGGTALFDSLTVALVWALLRRAGLGARGAALGAACYLLPTAALESFSIGEYANLGGQALALPLIAMLGLGLLGDKRARPHTAIPLTATVALGLLGHSGVTISVGALVASAWAIAWAGRLRRQDGGPSPIMLTVGAAAGLGVALLIFYTAPVYLGVLSERASPGGQGTPPLQVAADTLQALLGLAPPQDTRVALPPLLGPAGAAGLALLLWRRGPASTPLAALLTAWWVGTALTLGLLVVAGQGVRWAIFLYPALCAGAGVALDALWRRGPAGRLAAIVALAIIIGAGLVAWVVQIRDFIHV